MTRLEIAGVTAAVVVGVVHGIATALADVVRRVLELDA
jgi:hypothetical protein